MNKSYSLLALCGALSLTSCGNGESGAKEVGTVAEALAPAGSNALFVGASNLPSTLFPGERRLVQVTMRNTGAVSPDDDWTASGIAYELQSSPYGGFGWIHSFVPATVPVGSSNTFSIPVTAPSTSSTFRAQMNAYGFGLFGDVVSIPVTIDAGATPQWGCAFVPESSTLPESLAPGETRGVAITVRNTGQATWTANGFFLYAQDSPLSLWGADKTVLKTDVPPGQTTTFALSMKAPASAGTYTFQREMYDNLGLGVFRLAPHCVSTSIVVGGTPPLDAALVRQTFPVTMAPSESRSVVVTMKNTGTGTWLSDKNYMLYTLNNVWAAALSYVTAGTATGKQVDLGLVVTAPSTPGTYHQRWQMRKAGGADAAFFGEIIDVPVTVSSTVTPQYGATLVSQNLPTALVAGDSYAVSITLRNSGSTTWSPGSVLLDSANGFWGPTIVPLATGETITPGQSRTFTFGIKAPSIPGIYANSWRMRSAEVGLFGDRAAVTTTVVAPSCTPTNFPIGTYQLHVSETDCTSVFPDFIESCSSGQTAPVVEIVPFCGALPPDACSTLAPDFFLVSLMSGSLPGYAITSFIEYIPDRTTPFHMEEGYAATQDSPASGSITFDLDPNTGAISNFAFGFHSVGPTNHDITMAGNGSLVCGTGP